MSACRMKQLTKIYSNLYSTLTKDLRNAPYRIDLSKYGEIKKMNEIDLLNNLEELTEINKKKDITYLLKYKFKNLN